VRVKAVSVNPFDVKVRMRKQGTQDQPVILGWDAAGIVEAVGRDCSLFKPGDHVYYAGNINRPGTNAAFHLVDERIVGRKPKSLGFAQAAALPLTTITAWELLFDRIGVKRGERADHRSLLVVGGAGGVGSIAIQLARKLTALTVIATASRPQTQDWVRSLGAQHVIDHSQPFAPQLQAAGFASVVFQKYGQSEIPDLNAIERHETYLDTPELPHVLIAEASGKSREEPLPADLLQNFHVIINAR